MITGDEANLIHAARISSTLIFTGSRFRPEGLSSAKRLAALYTALVFCLTELTTAIPDAGGPFAYGLRAFEDVGGYIAGAATLIEFVLAPPATALAIGDYLHVQCSALSAKNGAADSRRQRGRLAPAGERQQSTANGHARRRRSRQAMAAHAGLAGPSALLLRCMR